MNTSKNYWHRVSKTMQQPSESRNKRPDTSEKEVLFLKKYLSEDDHVLDLGSGTGLIVNKIVPLVKSLIAVETFQGFSKYILDAPNLMVINADLDGFRIRRKFDKIICTGVMQYFTEPSVNRIYTNIYDMLKSDEGVFIMRIHCGMDETVTVKGSNENGADFFAEYRHVSLENQILKDVGFKDVQILDEAPEELNVWDNTRHYMFICRK